jgi:hypothetical protein
MARKARKDPCIPAAQGHGDSLVDTTKDTGVSTVKSPGEGPDLATSRRNSSPVLSGLSSAMRQMGTTTRSCLFMAGRTSL